MKVKCVETLRNIVKIQVIRNLIIQFSFDSNYNTHGCAARQAGQGPAITDLVGQSDGTSYRRSGCTLTGLPGCEHRSSTKNGLHGVNSKIT